MSTQRSNDHRLEQTQLAMLAEAAPSLLTVTDGLVWLTLGDGKDIILARGESAAIPTDCTPIASGLDGPAAFTLAPMSGSAWAQAGAQAA